MSCFRETVLDAECQPLSDIESNKKISYYIMYYTRNFIPHPIRDQIFHRKTNFYEITFKVSYFNAFSHFIFKYMQLYMTEANLNANNYFVFVRFFPIFTCVCMIEKNIYALYQWGIPCPCAWNTVHNRTFWRTLVVYFYQHRCVCSTFLWHLCFGWPLVLRLFKEDYNQMFKCSCFW